jgi:hypothetical protein
VTVRPEIVDAAGLDRAAWPDGPDAALARRYLAPLMREGVPAFIGNAHPDLRALLLDDAALPLTIHEPGPADCWSCAPSTQYHRYAKSEVRLVPSAVARGALTAIAGPWGAALRAGQIDRVVQVNNWMFSTNLLPALRPEQVDAIGALRDVFPAHAIVVRSLNARLDGPTLDRLAAAGARLVPSRQVYLLDPADPLPKKARWLLKRDERLFAEQGYEVVDVREPNEGDLARLVALYRELYLEKYSKYNVDFTERFVDLVAREGIMTVRALRRDGRFDAMFGIFALGGAMTATLFGFDGAVPQEVGLYRMLSVLTTREAQRRGLVLHVSAGAAAFKRHRGASVEIEVHAVFDDHLPAWRRAPWAALELALGRVGLPLVRRYKL